MDLSSADTGNRAREEEGDALQPGTKRARAEGGEVGEDGMETDGELYLSGAAPMPALMQPFLSPLSVLAEVAMSVSISDIPSATATSEEDDEWKAQFLEDCSEACDICWSTDKRKPQSQPMPDDDHLCICDPPHAHEHFSWDGILNDVDVSPAHDLKAAIQAMHGQQYWNGRQKDVFRFDRVLADGQILEQVLKGYLDVHTWTWVQKDPQSERCTICGDEMQELVDMVQTVGVQQMAAIRAWTEEGLDLYKVVTSVSEMATSKQCLEKILPYIRLLYEGLCLLPATHVFPGGRLHRGEKFIRTAFRDNLKPDDIVLFNTFTSFTTAPAKAAEFKNDAFMREFALFELEDGLISADPKFTLEERLLRFFEHFACYECYDNFVENVAIIAVEYEDDVAGLKDKLRTKFGSHRELENPEKPSRTTIVVEDGVGYRLGNLSVVPQEEEVLMEPGARLKVVEDNRTVAAQYGETQTKHLILKTVSDLSVSSDRLSLLTLKDGQSFASPARVKERMVVDDRLQVEALKALQRGDDLSQDQLNLLQRIVQRVEGGSAAARAKGASTQSTRSATRGLKLPDVRGMALSEEHKVQTLIQQLRDEVHDFDGACNWLLQVTVKQHDDKDDEEGERIDSSKVQTATDFRLYTVDAGQLLKVTVRNLSLARGISFTPIYLTEKGVEEPEGAVTLKGGQAQELPYPLEKTEGEKEESWVLKDENGKTLLKLRFAVLQTQAASGGSV